MIKINPLAPSIIRPIIQSFELISCIFTLFFSQILKVRHNQVGDGEAEDIAGEPGWDDV